jgi:hypothetical protein
LAEQTEFNDVDAVADAHSARFGDRAGSEPTRRAQLVELPPVRVDDVKPPFSRTP